MVGTVLIWAATRASSRHRSRQDGGATAKLGRHEMVWAHKTASRVKLEGNQVEGGISIWPQRRPGTCGTGATCQARMHRRERNILALRTWRTSRRGVKRLCLHSAFQLHTYRLKAAASQASLPHSMVAPMRPHITATTARLAWRCYWRHCPWCSRSASRRIHTRRLGAAVVSPAHRDVGCRVAADA